MSLRSAYGYDDDMVLEVNGAVVTIKRIVFKEESVLEFANDREDIEFVVAQVTDENDKLVVPDAVDVKDPNLVSFTFDKTFTGTAYVVACRSGAVDKLVTTALTATPIVKTEEKVWINQYMKRPYEVKVVAIEIERR